MPNDPRNGWHLERGVSISHILTTAIMLIGGLFYVADQNTSIELNTAKITTVDETSKERDLNNAQRINSHEIRQTRTIEKIDEKLQRIDDFVRGKK